MKKLFIVLLLACFSFAANSAEKDTLKVLMIGNSFADDCAEYVDDLAIADGRHLILGVLYRGGCSLERHCRYYERGESPYNYRKRVLGVYSDTPKISLKDGLLDEDWDIITVQQQSYDASQFNTFYPHITKLLKYVDELKTNADAEIYFVQTWAYGLDLAKKPNHKNAIKFKDGFDNDQMAMYEAIVRIAKRITKENKLKVLPAGTAIQNARAVMGDIMTRDGYHLHKQIGRYVAGCAMYEALIGSVVGNTFIVDGVSKEDAAVAQKAAKAAVKKPWKLTK